MGDRRSRSGPVGKTKMPRLAGAGLPKFALVESHGRIAAEWPFVSMSALPAKAAAPATGWRTAKGY
jgi:hypothetical protein